MKSGPGQSFRASDSSASLICSSGRIARENTGATTFAVDEISNPPSNNSECRPDSEQLAHASPLIARQRIGQIVFGCEPRVQSIGSELIPKNPRGRRLKAAELIAETAGLFGAARGVVLRIEKKDHGVPAPELAQAHWRAVLIGQFEIGRGLSDAWIAHR